MDTTAAETTPTSMLCPRCREFDLFEGHNRYFCGFCMLSVCPICLQSSSPSSEGNPLCEHYFAEFCGGTGEMEDPVSDENLWLKLLSLDDLSADTFRDASWKDEHAWTEKVWECASETMEAMTAEEKADRFGVLWPVLDEDGHDFVGTVCEILDIPLQTAYHDDSAYYNVYYTEIGREAAWARVAPAIEYYSRGLQWLERHAREWA